MVQHLAGVLSHYVAPTSKKKKNNNKKLIIITVLRKEFFISSGKINYRDDSKHLNGSKLRRFIPPDQTFTLCHPRYLSDLYFKQGNCLILYNDFSLLILHACETLIEHANVTYVHVKVDMYHR